MRWSAEIQGVQVTVRVSRDDAGRVEDIHAAMGPPGSSLGLMLEAVWRSASVSLDRGVPLHNVLKGLRGARFEPSGRTTDVLVPECLSVVDYVARAVEARAG